MDRFLIKPAFGSEVLIGGRRLFWSDCEIVWGIQSFVLTTDIIFLPV